MRLKGGIFGECKSKVKHDFIMSILEGQSLNFCNLKFNPVRDWQKIAKISNHWKDDVKGGMPVANFLRLLQTENLHNDIGIDEVSRFCVINSDGEVCHYSNTTDKDGRMTLPSSQTVQILKQTLSI